MRHMQNMQKAMRYTCLLVVIVLGLITIIGTGGGGGGGSGSGSENGADRGGDNADDNGGAVIDKTNSIGMTFNSIEPGTFMMGSPEDEPGHRGDETLHQVTLTQGYYMQTTPVTQGEWKAVMGSNPSYFSECGDDCPVESVTWLDIQDFISKLNDLDDEGQYALPTEAQWEYAARAGSRDAFANGSIKVTGSGYDPVLDSMGWYTYNSTGRTHPVAQKDPNAWGLYDMHGNVWEWVADWYGDYAPDSVTDPTGPSSGFGRVVRGGSWSNVAVSCRSANRTFKNPGSMDYNYGFRVVLYP